MTPGPFLIQNLLVVAFLVAVSFAVFSEWRKPSKKHKQLLAEDPCYKSYIVLKESIEICNGEMSLELLNCQVNDFFDNYYGSHDYQTLKTYYRDLEVRLSLKLRKLKDAYVKHKLNSQCCF